MKIGVAGLWHLGVMYAVGFAKLGHLVIAYDPNADSISGLKIGDLLVFEPKLSEMLLENLKSGNLKFTSDESDLEEVELLVLAYDTPIDEEDNADVDFVISEFRRIAEHLNSDAHILVSSQLPVGSSDLIQEIQKKLGRKGNVIVQPENLRLGKAIDSFFSPGRIVAGTQDGKLDQFVIDAFNGIEAPIIWMHRRSAEVTKHALNTFLATSVTFMGELSEICEKVGADAKEVEIGLKSDPRIGTRAYLSPGLGFAGGTLGRDVRKLSKLQSGIRDTPGIFTSLMVSNRHNNDWVSRSLAKIPAQKEGLRICFWGISYTDNTDTLRRSETYTLMKKLAIENVRISYVEDLLIKDVVDSRILCVDNLEESISNIDVLVVNKILKNHLKTPKVLEQLQRYDLWILDPSRILLELNSDLIERARYLTVGKGV
jgi:UDPglucose 6-dehydrogenase